MIDLEKAKNEFINYTNNYDLTNSHITRKIYHSLRVMEASKKIAENLNLTKEQIDLYGINEKTAHTKKAFYTKSSFMLAGNRARVTYNDGRVEYYNICPQNVWRVHSEALLVPVENEEEE